MSQKEIIYFGDPMCSWCYGFTNVIQELRASYSDRASVRLVMGGLRPDGTHVVDDRYRNFLRGHWQEISERTGQPFDLTILENTGWIYDTEKACRAVVVARRLKPEVEWEYFAAAQRGFYHHNHNPNDPESFARIGETFGIEREVFLKAYADAESIEATQEDFRQARSVGVDSFPTVLVRDERGLAALTIGYRPLQALVGPLEHWLGQ
ncbi:DsbA family protein [Aromatoleum anaerobium]|uniref:DsbA family protein n=1 Tax=Aromatoleum anaerobium TaxID=182180 RepID=A0N0U7_9RHOO|nr:DsbA family protein [Aromatoleum anaerobium]ABK58625.1 putative isomerase [Aromatoleum anaerobium]MCK0505367.1 DsbA family protein [Aromatoleum anaerobium]